MKALSSVLAHTAVSATSLLMIAAATSVGTSIAGEPALAPVQCLATAGQSVQETDPTARRGKDIPIDHIIVIMQENRSFDHYFQGLPGSGQTDADVAPLDVVNVDRKGNKLGLQLAKSPCTGGPPHSWNSVHQQMAEGKMDGFAANGGQTAMLHYDDAMLPYYYALANHFAIADRWFSSVPGPTFPNRMYMVAASSFGHIQNDPPPPRASEFSVFDQLEDAGLSWGIYSSSTPSLEERLLPKLRERKDTHFMGIDDFEKAAASGKLPAFSWVTSAEEHNEHPPKNVQAGQRFVANMVDTVMKSPNWSRTALFFTYDEHGGFYDHVAPPAACAPDDIAPIRGPKDIAGNFETLGPRVPMILISPYAKQHYVSHTVYDHTSILRFLQARFNLPALSARDANAQIPFDLFDFDSPPRLTLPRLPTANIDPAFIGHCQDTKTTDFEDEVPVAGAD